MTKFTYELRWRIIDRGVRQIDRSRTRLNRLCSITLDQADGDPFPCSSLETAKRIRTGVRKIKREIQRAEKNNLSVFDRLVLEDCKRNAEIVGHYYNYTYDSKDTTKIGAFVSNVFGRGSYNTLLRSVSPKRFPHKDLHQESELMHGVSSRKIEAEMLFEAEKNPEFRRLKAELIKALQKNKKIVNQFFIEQGIVQDMDDYYFEFAPLGTNLSFWEGHNLLMAIDPDRLICHKPKGKKDYEFYDAFVKAIAAHELAHGLHEMLSAKTMPFGLRSNPENYLSIIHGSSSEGIALITEEFFLQYMRKNQEALGLKSKDIERATASTKCYVPKKLHKIMHGLLERKDAEERENKKFPDSLYRPGHLELARVTGVKRYRDIYSFEDDTVEDTFVQMSYFFGQQRVSSLVEEMKRQGLEKKVMISALLSGVWCDPEAQRKFIFDLYIPRLRKYHN